MSTTAPASAPLAPPGERKALTAPVAPVLLRTVLQEARRVGVDTRPLCRGLAFVEADLDRPGFTVSHGEAATLLRRALAAIGRPHLGLELGQRSNVANLGVLALGLLASPTLHEALQLLLRFPASAGLLVTLHETLAGQRLSLLATPLFGEHDLEGFLIDELFAGLVRLGRRGSGTDQAPLAVELVRQSPADGKPYEVWFRCPVQFGSRHNRIVFDTRWLDQPLATASPMAWRCANELLLAEAAAADIGLAVEHAVARAIRLALPAVVALGQVASTLNLSERTLRRRLLEAGLTFRALQDEARKSHALALVTNGRMDLAAVALETGFADISTFRRAFRRWTGTTPAALRRAAPSAAADGSV